MLLYVHRDNKDCLGRGAQDGHLDFHTAPVALRPQRPSGTGSPGRPPRLSHSSCCFTSTETIRNWEPRTATSTFTQILLLYVHRDHQELGAQDGHLDFHTAPVALRPQRPSGTGSPGRPPRLSHRSCCFTSTETIRNWEPRTATSTFTQLLLLYVHRDHQELGAQDDHLDFHTDPVALRPQRPSGTGSPGRPPRLSHSSCCFTSTETIRNWEPRTTTSTFTQLLLLYVHRDHQELGAQDGHLDFHTAPVALRPQRPSGTGSPGRPPRLSHRSCCFTSTETIRNWEPRTATSTFTQLLLLYVHRDHQELGAQDDHLDFHTDPVALRPQRPSGTGSPGRPPRLSHSSCCFTSTETIRNWEPRTTTSTFTQILLLYVHRDHQELGAQDDHLDFHTAPVALRPQRPSGTGSPGRPPRLSHSSCCFTSTETIRNWEPRTTTSTFTQLLLLYVHRDHQELGAQDDHLDFHTAPVALRPQRPSGTGSPGRPPRLSHSSCCFTSTETIRNWEPRTATSTYTQLLLLYVHRDHQELGAQDGHLDFHTAPVALRPQRPSGTGSPGRPPRLSHSSCCFTSTETIRNWEPRTATSTYTQLLLLYVHRDHQELGAQDGHLDLHTAPEL